jgi:hypothetical protein
VAFGSVLNASPSTVLPNNLCRAFVVRRRFFARLNAYRAGETQVGLLSSTARSEWEISRRLTAVQLVTLRDFFDARGVESFYFYDLLTHKSATYDPTGVLTTGRYTVRFMFRWSQSMEIARSVVPIGLMEVN